MLEGPDPENELSWWSAGPALMETEKAIPVAMLILKQSYLISSAAASMDGFGRLQQADTFTD